MKRTIFTLVFVILAGMFYCSCSNSTLSNKMKTNIVDSLTLQINEDSIGCIAFENLITYIIEHDYNIDDDTYYEYQNAAGPASCERQAFIFNIEKSVVDNDENLTQLVEKFFYFHNKFINLIDSLDHIDFNIIYRGVAELCYDEYQDTVKYRDYLNYLNK